MTELRHAAPGPHSPPLRVDHQPCKILVIDDEPTTLNLLKILLTKASFEVVACSTAIQGLLELKQSVFDCIITDAILPHLSGYDFVKTVRKFPQFSNLPILMITRKRHRDDVKKAVDAGVTDYILKPVDEPLFLDKVELCIKRGLGKRYVFELPIEAPFEDAGIQLRCKILSLSESGITLGSPIPISENQAFTLKTRLFHDIGIDFPSLRLVQCELIPSHEEREAGYEIKFSFLGLAEQDLRKIRTWMQRETIRRKHAAQN